MRDIPFGKVKKTHPYAWLWEPLEGDPGFMLRPMFGGRAAYVDGRLVLYFPFPSDRDPDWLGVCACTAHEHHASLMAEFPALEPHPVLPKWLFLSEEHERFESVAEKLVALAKWRDPRLGVIGKAGKRRARKGEARKEETRKGKIK
jgi:hypothetical protein